MTIAITAIVDKARERIEPALREATGTVANAIGDAATEPSEAPSPDNVRVTSSMD